MQNRHVGQEGAIRTPTGLAPPVSFDSPTLTLQPVSPSRWERYRCRIVQQFPGRDADSTRRSESAQQVVARTEAYLRANLDGRVSLTELCRIVGLSERGLRNAFYRVHGVSPTRWIMGERLQGVRNALIDEAVPSTTVTSVAAEHGFYELGRFAAIYKDAFGEAPSDTLRSTSRTSTLAEDRKRTRRCSPEYAR